MCNGGCECGCAGTCNSTICGSTGGCCGACNACPPPPPPTCGCGQLILSGETCVGGTYYIVVSSENVYYQFNFGDVLLTPISGYWNSANDCIANYIAFYYGLIDFNNAKNPLPSNFYLTQSPPSGSVPGPGISGYGIAQNSFFWADWAYSNTYNVFTSYGVSGCNSTFPSGLSQYPSGSITY